MKLSETEQYRNLRIGTGVAMMATFAMLLWLSLRSWPIVQQALWPATVGCGCGVVAMQVPPMTSITGGLVILVSALMLGRLAFFFIRHIRRSRRVSQEWTAIGQRTVYQHAIGEDIIMLNSPGRQAMTMGIFQPRVYITADLLPSLRGSELTAVLRHEQEHCRQYDPLWSAVIDSFSAAWWRLPMLQQLVAASLTLRELAADAAATGDYRHAEGLSGAIVALAGQRPAADVIAFSPNHDRVQKLLDQTWRPNIRLWRWSYAVVLGTVLFIVGAVLRLTPSATAAVPPAIAQVCRETRLQCPQVEEIPYSLMYRISIPQSVYVFPGSIR